MKKNITVPEILQDGRKPWKQKKMKSVELSNSFRRLGQIKKANRILDCGSQLTFAVNCDTGEKHLHDANFCRERLCPMCSWRRSLKIFWAVSRVMDDIQQKRPELVPLFLTLTVRNCPSDGLSQMLDKIFSGWVRMSHNDRFKRLIFGWFRALEVTYNPEDDTYHPHIHAIILVDKAYFKGEDYMQTQDWVKLWRRSLRLDYDPICDVRKVKGKKRKAVAEVAKYAVKDTDYMHKGNPDLTDRIVEVLSAALKGRRLYAFGGVMKDAAKALDVLQADEGDLTHIEEDTVRADVGTLLVTYRWKFGFGLYVKSHVEYKGSLHFERG